MTYPDTFRALCAELLEKYDLEWRARERIKAALSQPEAEPAGPTLAHEAYVAFVQICKGNSDDAGTYEADEELVRRALKRLDDLEQHQPTLTPIPVSERLPGAEDCDAEGRCWWGYPKCPTQARNQWRLAPEADRWGSELAWLPAHALPLPAAPREEAL